MKKAILPIFLLTVGALVANSAQAAPDGNWTCTLYEGKSPNWKVIKSGILPFYYSALGAKTHVLDLSLSDIYLSVKCESSTFSSGSRTYLQLRCSIKDSMGQGSQATSFGLDPIEITKLDKLDANPDYKTVCTTP